MRVQRILAGLALGATLLFVWALTHEYRGLVYDAQIYAVQALSKIRPALAADLFLQNESQDRFTVFPRVYAWVITCVGLRSAALLLTIGCSVWLLAASWSLVANLANRDFAWLALFLMIIVPGYYGAFGVFYIAEPFMTARLPAEALVVTALACHFKGLERTGLLMAFAALFVHPLMALPGLLTLICLSLSRRAIVVGVILGTFGAAAAALAASHLPSVGRFLTVMDAPWVDVVRERSQFLFLELWTGRDWALNARPFMSLGVAAMILPDGRARKLAVAAIAVGATGLAVAAIASLVGPVAIFMQGQAWRWVWMTSFVGILLLLPTAYEAWREERCGRACAVLLIAGWTLPVETGITCASLALLLWALRPRIPPQLAEYTSLATALLVLGIIGWTLMESWAVVSKATKLTAGEPSFTAHVRELLALKVWCVLLAGSLWFLIRSSRAALLPISISVVLGASTVFLLFQSSARLKPYGSTSDIREFTDWRDRIPPASTVFVTNGYDSGSFVWFTLQRNNYLSPGQSAGVVFSRATALEVQRRSEVLLPLADPNWKMLTSLRDSASAARRAGATVAKKFRPLTAQALAAVCRDPALGFVVSPDDVGFDPIKHSQAGAWKDWKLYDCSHVRAQASTT